MGGMKQPLEHVTAATGGQGSNRIKGGIEKSGGSGMR
jgi:hypothetical protein